MTENKEVTGVICIPIPPLAKGKHTLSTTYTDTIYQTASKCFQIEVIDSEVTIDVGNINGRPDCTLNVSVNVTNDVDQPVEDGVIKIYYHNTQDSPQMQTFVNGLNGQLLLGSAEVGSDGVAHLSFQVPSEVRGGKLILKTTYTHSDMGYDDKTTTSPLYIKRNGLLTLQAFKNVGGIKSEVLNNGWVDEPNKVEVVATLYDDNDADKIPLSGVPINIKMNEETITLDVEGSDEKSYTNSQGKVTVNSLATTGNMNNFTLTAMNEAKEYINSLTKTLHLQVRRVINAINVATQASNIEAHQYTIQATLTGTTGQRLLGAVGIVRVNGITYKTDGINGNGDTKRFTEVGNGVYTMDIDLGDLQAGTKTIDVQFGGDWDGSLYQSKVTSTSITLTKRNVYVRNANVTWRNGGISVDFNLVTNDDNALRSGSITIKTIKTQGDEAIETFDLPTKVSSFNNIVSDDIEIKYDVNGKCQIWLPASYRNGHEYTNGQTYSFRLVTGSTNLYNEGTFTVSGTYNG